MFFKFEWGSKSLEYILASIEQKAILEGDDKSISSKFSDSSLYVTPAPTIGVSAVAFFREFLHQIRKKYRSTTTESKSLPRLPSPDNIPIFFPPDAKKSVNSNNKCNVALYLSWSIFEKIMANINDLLLKPVPLSEAHLSQNLDRLRQIHSSLRLNLDVALKHIKLN